MPPGSEMEQVFASVRGTFRSVWAFSAIINLLMLAPSLYMLQVYDRAITSRNETTLLMLTLMVLGTLLFISALEVVRGLVLVRIGANLDMRLNNRIFVASFEQSLRQTGGNTGQALEDLTSLRQFVTGSSIFAFFDAPWLPIQLLVIFMLDWQLGIFSLIGALLLIILAWINETVTRKSLDQAGVVSIAAKSLAINQLRNAEIIEAMGMLPQMMARWFQFHSHFLLLQAQASEKAGVVMAVSRFARMAVQSLILGLGALLVLQDRITPGMMVVASILMGRAMSPVDQIITAWRSWTQTRSAFQRLTQLLQGHPPRQAVMSLPKLQGRVSVEAVTVVPPGSNVPVLRHLNFSLDAGDVLGIVGPSGSGKSSVARLLMGVWPAVAGKVRLDGAELSQWNRTELGPEIGYLPQDVELFRGSVAENIARFGRLDTEKIILAAQRAGVHQMILRLPKGYDTVLGDDGAGLSGGQKQRLGLARALYGDPALLVLDEPNSSLDESGEQALFAAISELRQRGKTVVLISHRKKVIELTSKLLLMREGAAQAFGPTSNVLAELKRSSALSPSATRG